MIDEKYHAKDPKVRLALKREGILLAITMLAHMALGGYYLNALGYLNNPWIGLILTGLVVLSLVPVYLVELLWFSYCLPRVDSPEQLYLKMDKLPGFKKIYDSYISKHPQPAYYTPANVPSFQLPILIRKSKEGSIVGAIFFALPCIVIVTIFLLYPEQVNFILVLGSPFLLFGTAFCIHESYNQTVLLSFTDKGVMMNNTSYEWHEIRDYEIALVNQEMFTYRYRNVRIPYLKIYLKNGKDDQIRIPGLEINSNKVDDIMNSLMLKMNG